MKKQKMLMAAGLMIFVLSGCSLFNKMDPEKLAPTVTNTSIFVTNEGTVKQVIVDNLDKDYYNPSELQQSVQKAVSLYNQFSPEGVSLTEFVSGTEASPKEIRVTLDFKSVADYGEFNERAIFSGTVAEATAAGYEIPSLIDKDGNVVGIVGNADTSDSKILISEEAQDVYIPGKITYVSANVSAFHDYVATLPGGELSFVIYK